MFDWISRWCGCCKERGDPEIPQFLPDSDKVCSREEIQRIPNARKDGCGSGCLAHRKFGGLILVFLPTSGMKLLGLGDVNGTGMSPSDWIHSD